MRAILVATVAVLMTTPAGAQGFVANRTQWNALGDARKADYVMGVYDGLNQVSHGEAEIYLATIEARTACLNALGITSRDLALMVDEGYAADAAAWSDPPLALLLRQTNRVCRSQINAAVVAAGGEPFIP